MMLIVTVVFVSLAEGTESLAQLHLQEAPADAVQIEVTGQQSAWNIRYPGRRQVWPNDPKLINDQENPVGLDTKDAAAKDDIVSVNRMAIPVNRPIKVICAPRTSL
jgi:heme/copper-type cytochrome/quinol oxidase subunit 2